MKHIYLLLIGCAVASAGCIKQIEVDFTPEVKPVLNALLQCDSVVKADVSMSVRPNEFLEGQRNDAVVKVYENGVFMETLQMKLEYNNARYVGTKRLKSGSHYRVTAEVPGYPMVDGEDVIPGQLGEFSAVLEKRSVNGAEDYFIKLKINDPATERNYYRVRLFAWYDYNNGITPSRSHAVFTYEGPEFWDLYQGDESGFQYVFDDAMFGGHIRQLLFKTRKWTSVKKFELEVSQLSRDAYLYLQSLELQRIKNHQAFAEKVTVHNNIRNGLGIVGGIAIGWKIFIP